MLAFSKENTILIKNLECHILYRITREKSNEPCNGYEKVFDKTLTLMLDKNF